MTAPRKKLCPVCWRSVGRTKGDCIEGHWDSAHNPCLASGEPYRITLSRKPVRQHKHVDQWHSDMCTECNGVAV